MSLKKTGRRVYLFKNPLDEIFTEHELADKLVIAQRRVVASFDTATEIYRGRVRGTDNYIIGVGCKQKELAHYIAGQAKQFVSIDELPFDLRDKHSPGHLNRIAQQAEYDIILCVLNEMCSCAVRDISYDEVRGLWQIRQSVVDEYRRSLRRARRAMKFDRRNEHGMVRSQRINRGRPAGLSVSIASSSVV